MLTYSTKINSYWIKDCNIFSMQNETKFKNYFFSFIKNIEIIKKTFKVYHIYDIHEHMDNANINIMLCVENCNFWKHYSHINKYGNFGNTSISIYLYNHFNRFIRTDTYIVIPVIYLQIDYFKTFYNSIKPTIFTPFNQKKLCLIVSIVKNNYNNKLTTTINKLKQLGECDYIKDITILSNKSCYHDLTLLNVINQYKFIYCFENSINDGYITEKIFNVFFGRSIPIYFGPNDKYRYFNKNSFIDIENMDDNIINQIKCLDKNEQLYNEFLNNEILNDKFDNENYIEQANSFISCINKS